tara:strand:+ start:1766 stop:2032 length:267 start_codon:yes stop_codon:yes gene_type:complete
MAANFLNNALLSNDLMLIVPNDTESKAGKVPSPKKNMIRAPLIASALAKAQVRVEYTSPQGSQPHNAPKAKALLIFLIGMNFFVFGEI